jgi:heme-degrading monooxygenase HmoA
MFARNVSIHLKSNMLSDYTRSFENEVLPLLRKQKGFKDEITLSNPGSLDVIVISLWESKTNAEAYNTNTYPEVLKTFARMIDGTPKVQTFESVTSTFHNVAVAV